jgi:hypothetical protein
MTRAKYDLVIEAVHYSPTGKIEWVRGYERRGPTYSDRILFNRNELVDRLHAGKKIYAGKRIPFLASTFEVSGSLNLVEKNGKQVVLVGEMGGEDRDRLKGVPII